MSTPPTFRKSGKRYSVNGEWLPSVTTIIKDGVPSPALVSWAAKSVAGAAVDRWDELAGMSPSARLRELEGAAWAQRDAAALQGTRVHEYGEELMRTGHVDVPPEDQGTIEAYARLAQAFDVEPVCLETPVCNPEHGYAGTLDMLAYLTVDGRRELWLLDLKRGKGVYESHCLQAAAYRHATWRLTPEGEVQSMLFADRAGVVHLTSDSAELIPIDAGERIYSVFRHAAVVARFKRETAEAYKERRAWPVGRAIRQPVRQAAS